ncbi:MAG: hypothetical protein ACR2JB_02510 [Bryobacteraceae bacterium]
MAIHAGFAAETENVTEDVLTLQRDGVVRKKGAFSRECSPMRFPFAALGISNPGDKSGPHMRARWAAHVLFGITIEKSLRVLRSDPSASPT